jgi:hypothetical protein
MLTGRDFLDFVHGHALAVLFIELIRRQGGDSDRFQRSLPEVHREHTEKVRLTLGDNLKAKSKRLTSRRAIANHIFWRIMQSTLTFLDNDLRGIGNGEFNLENLSFSSLLSVLTYEKDAFGKEVCVYGITQHEINVCFAFPKGLRAEVDPVC